MEVLEIKRLESEGDLHPLIEKRWSPRAFSSKQIPDEDLNEIFEAASWAASAMNEQPWQYIYATNGTPGFDKLWNCLNEGNQSWTKNAPVLFVALYRERYRKNGKPNRSALHDLGMANAQLMLQASANDVYGHFMGGFNGEKLKSVIDVEEGTVPFCMGVLGYLGDAEKLDEPYRTRERTKRTRNPLTEFVTKI